MRRRTLWRYSINLGRARNQEHRTRLAPRPRTLLLILVLGSIASNMVLALIPPSLSFWDEQVYNYASELILQGQSCPTVALTISTSTVPIAVPCNYEHPPLVKLLGSLTLYVFGNLEKVTSSGSLAWRIESLLSLRLVQFVMGALSIPLLYTIAMSITKNTRLALLAGLLLFLDPLYALFSRTDYLDVPMLFFGLCAYAVYFGQRRIGKVNSYLVSGVFLGLSLLSKETGIALVVPLVVYHLLFDQATWKRKTMEAGAVLGSEAVVAIVGLQLYDTLAATPFMTFANQIEYMLQYSNHLVCPNLCNFPGPNPWYFLPTYNYWMVEVSYNPVLLWSASVWVPVGLLLTFRQLRSETQLDGETRLFVFAALLFAVTMAENELLYLAGRIIWVWYFLPAIPALGLGEAFLLTRPAIPAWLRITLGVSVVIGYLLAYIIGPSLLLYD